VANFFLKYKITRVRQQGQGRPILPEPGRMLPARTFNGVAGILGRDSVANSRWRNVLAVLLRSIRIHSGKGFPNGIVDGARRLGVAPGETTPLAVPDGPDEVAGLEALPLPAAMRVSGTTAGTTGH
jgi:hypothetical protein